MAESRDKATAITPVGTSIDLTADDGHKFAAYEARPSGPAKGRVVVVQEILGVDAHIRSMCERYAGAGFHAVAPALFDRIERGVDLDFDIEHEQEKVYEIYEKLHPSRLDDVIRDVRATADHLGGSGEVGIVGYCYGGLISWLAAARLELGCASCYYGQIKDSYVDEVPMCPTACHFGNRDQYIPLSVANTIKHKHPAVEVHLYEADHAFNNDGAVDFFDGIAAAAAHARTLALFSEHLE